MIYLDKIRERIVKIKNPFCMGLDPILKKLPLQGDFSFVVESFYLGILEEQVKKKIFPAAIKPNLAYFEAYGADGFASLKKIIAEYQKEDMLVILDAKRGDISSTSAAYAEMAFDYFSADAVTLSPYMGKDTLTPFQEKVKEKGKGLYMLVRTSNPSANDFQFLSIDGIPLYQKVAQKLVEWNDGNLGAVVGATHLADMEKLFNFWSNSNSNIPCLIPGVSVANQGQGADLKEVLGTLSSEEPIHLINSSSGLNYAYLSSSHPFAKASVIALEEMIVLTQVT